MSEVTALLLELRQGNRTALDRLLPLVYQELRRIARNYLRSERPSHTLQPTALVHEAYLRLVEQRESNWQNRAHFFAIAASLMRRVLVDHARRHQAGKRGGARERVSLDEALVVSTDDPSALLVVHEALEQLAARDPRQAQIAELRCFGGLTAKEISAVLDLDEVEVQRDWRMAKAWLRTLLAPLPPER